jgi:hypothetical protein
MPFNKNFEKVSINKAFQLLNVEVSCNMEYYLNHLDEIEKDLNRKVNEIELKETNKKLEQELFYNQMCKLFGTEGVPGSYDSILDKTIEPELVYERAYMLKDFRVFYKMNYHCATAQRGNYYLLFQYSF